jgi:acetoacetyl-CoA synthetase
VIDEVGELVITQPMPSMPVAFWNDPDGQRYREAYFEMFPGAWRQGDWIRFTSYGSSVIYGRSDSTINRFGIRIGTAEIYRVVEELPEVVDSMVVDLEYLGRPSFMPLFVVLRPGAELDRALIERIGKQIRTKASGRHVPDVVVQVKEIPLTLSGKKMEVPVRKLLLGASWPGCQRTPCRTRSMDFFAEYAKALAHQR